MLYSLSKAEMERLRQIDFPVFKYSAEMLSALFRTDPDIVQTILPKPLVPADEPLGWVFVARYPETNFGLSYNEGALFVKAMYKGEPGWYCLALPVDNDMAMVAGRETMGFPKKMAEKITLERTDNHVKGSVVRRGVEILHIEAELTDPVSATHLDAVGPEVSTAPTLSSLSHSSPSTTHRNSQAETDPQIQQESPLCVGDLGCEWLVWWCGRGDSR